MGNSSLPRNIYQTQSGTVHTVVTAPSRYKHHRIAILPMPVPKYYQVSKSSHSNHHSTIFHNDKLPNRMVQMNPNTIHILSTSIFLLNKDANMHEQNWVAILSIQHLFQSILHTDSMTNKTFRLKTNRALVWLQNLLH